MIKKVGHKIYLFLFTLLGGCTFLLVTLFAFMQTNLCERWLTSYLVSQAKKEGITLKIEGLDGLPPFKWTLQKAELLWDSKGSLIIENATVRIAFFPLLQGQLSLSFLQAETIALSFTQPSIGMETEKTIPLLPFHLAAKKVKVKKFHLYNLLHQEYFGFSFSGQTRVSKDYKEIQLNISLQELSQENYLRLELLSSEKKGRIHANASIDIQNSQSLSQFFRLPLDASIKTSFRCRGPWSFWENSFKLVEGPALEFHLDIAAKEVQSEKFPFLNSDWTLQGDLSLYPDLSANLESCALNTDWLKTAGRLQLNSSGYPIQGSLVIHLKELEKFRSFFPLPIYGPVDARVGFTSKAIFLQTTSQTLSLGSTLFSPVEMELKAFSSPEGLWSGKASCKLENAQIPCSASLTFSLVEPICSFQDIHMQIGESTLGGTGEWIYKDALWNGSFFVLSGDLKSFRPLFPEADLEGRLGGRFALAQKKEEFCLSANLLFQNVRYKNSLVDSLSFEADIHDLFNQTRGTLSIDGNNLFFPGGLVSHFLMTSSPSEELTQYFSIQADGNWKQDFSISSSGTIVKKYDDWSCFLETLYGNFLDHPFRAQPFTIENKKNSFSLNNCHMRIAEGNLFINYQSSDEQATISTQASHLPLGVITLFYPHLAIQGLTSFQGTFEGSINESQGYFLATLEEIDPLHQDPRHPIQAKGSLQIHCNPKTVQLYAHIQGTQEQFVDWTATLPICYTLSPLSVHIDKNKPLSSELTLEGSLEDLFNFLQTGAQKTTGWVTSHLLLSGSAQTPSLQGEINIQRGSYENYIFGMRLKNIDAHLLALGPTVRLHSFSATDKLEGTLQALGDFHLFPWNFAIHADLHQLQVIRTPSFSAQGTGILDITGATSMTTKIQGDLVLDKTSFLLAEQLLSDIPSLPITYIHKPIHLQKEELFLPMQYPLLLDLTLTAGENVSIKGKGLDSEWSGRIQLVGSPVRFTGKGSLILTKGEFQFSGKTFTLTQGELFFSDQPGRGAYLKITGQLQLPQAMILAHMQGPLTAPRLTFQSTPPLPTSSILSLILFNKDISEVSPLQALQLAQVIMSLSGGGGPDVLGAIRKTIGVDRLNISGKEGTDEIVLQIGWYLTHGITVSLSQSATSSDIIVELDLKNGFLFQAETQNQEEGKFSLKWNCNY